MRVRAPALILLLVAAACARAPVDERPPAAAGSPSSTSRSQGAPPEAAKVLRFEAPRLGGGVLRGADYAGKDVAIWFWAPW
jgi:hypothetical protein